MTKRDLELEFEKLIPELKNGMLLGDCYELILNKLKDVIKERDALTEARAKSSKMICEDCGAGLSRF